MLEPERWSKIRVIIQDIWKTCGHRLPQLSEDCELQNTHVHKWMSGYTPQPSSEAALRMIWWCHKHADRQQKAALIEALIS